MLQYFVVGYSGYDALTTPGRPSLPIPYFIWQSQKFPDTLRLGYAILTEMLLFYTRKIARLQGGFGISFWIKSEEYSLKISAQTVADVFPLMANVSIVRCWAGIEGVMPDGFLCDRDAV